jgi:hypothetical protein
VAFRWAELALGYEQVAALLQAWAVEWYCLASSAVAFGALAVVLRKGQKSNGHTHLSSVAKVRIHNNRNHRPSNELQGV